MGPDSPLGMLWREGGHCLFLGTGYHTNTFKHVVETTLGATCIGRRTEALAARLPDGRTVKLRTWGFRSALCDVMDPGEPAERAMSGRGAHVRGKVGECTVTFLKLADCFEVLSAMLRDGGCAPVPHRAPHAARTRSSPTGMTSAAV